MPPIDEKVRICLLYEYRLGSIAEVASYNLNKVFGPGAISLFSVTHYYAKFRRGDTNLEVKQRGKYTMVDPDIVQAMVERDPTLTCRKIAKVFGVNPTTISRLLRKMKKGAVLPKYNHKAVPAEKLLEEPSSNCQEESQGLPRPVPAERLLVTPSSHQVVESPRIPEHVSRHLREEIGAGLNTRESDTDSSSRNTLDRRRRAEDEACVMVKMPNSDGESKKEIVVATENFDHDQLRLFEEDGIEGQIFKLH
ncbi:hypothetical protein OSTOST_12482 [Ostertagia ostertagi]